MLKLTSPNGGRAIFVNPKLVTDIAERTVRDVSLDEKNTLGRAITFGRRVEGCIICFGGPEDSACAVMEDAEAVAYEVSSYIETYGIIDVAANQLIRAEVAKAKEPEKCAEDCPGCDYCLPF